MNSEKFETCEEKRDGKVSLLLFQHRAARGDRSLAARRSISECGEGGTSADSHDVHDLSTARELSRDIPEVSVPVVVSIQPDGSESGTRTNVAERTLVMAPPPAFGQDEAPLAFKLTIVVPVYNEEHTIRQVLESLIAQPIPGDFEIIVVDDGSTDRTKRDAPGELAQSARLRAARDQPG